MAHDNICISYVSSWAPPYILFHPSGHDHHMTHRQEGRQESEPAEQEVASFKEELTQPPLNPPLKGEM